MSLFILKLEVIMIAVELLVGTLTLLWIYFFWSRRKYYLFSLKVPGPWTFPFIGIAYKLRNSADVLYEFPKYALQNNLKTYFTWLATFPALYTIDPNVAEIFLRSPECLNKSIIYDVITEVIGLGILTLKAPTWNYHRKLLNVAFNHKTLLNFIPIFHKQIDGFCENLATNDDNRSLKEKITKFTLHTAFATTMGLNFEGGANEDFTEKTEELLGIINRRLFNPILRNSTVFRATSLYKPYIKLKKSVLETGNICLMKRIKYFEEGHVEDSKHNIFIDQVIKMHKNNELTFDDIISEVNIMVFAAFETSAITMFSIIMVLAMHPEHQEKVIEEILAIYPDKECEVKYEDLKNMIYLEMCISETLRLFPSIPMIGRTCTEDVPIDKDIVVPKGTQIVIDIFNIQRDKDTWGPDAHKFNPDNFLPSNQVDRHAFSYMPFSKGARNCIGWQYAKMFLKIALAKIFRKYRFTTDFKMEELRCVHNITLRYVTYPEIEIHKR